MEIKVKEGTLPGGVFRSVRMDKPHASSFVPTIGSEYVALKTVTIGSVQVEAGQTIKLITRNNKGSIYRVK